MSAIDSYRPFHRTGRVGFIARLIGTVTLWNDGRITRKALAQLSDRELHDIGLTRFDADNIGR